MGPDLPRLCGSLRPMTDLATTEAIIPEGYDPNGPDANRENYARALADEAQRLYSKVERFYVVFATIRDQQLYYLLGYNTIQDFALGEYGVSPATAQRWVVTGRAIAELDIAPPQTTELGKPVTHTGNPTVPLQRVTDEMRISQREAARLAKVKKEQEEAEAERELREAREAALRAAREAKEARRREIEAAVPEVLVAKPVRHPSTSAERTPRISARATINRIMAAIDGVDDARVVAAAATASEKAQIVAFAAHFAPRRVQSEEVMSEKDCAPHPVARRLGKDCGRCGARGVWK